MPGVRVLHTYERSWLRFDIVAGIVLAAILVPQGMAYAELAGLPPVTGLYTTIACLVGYAVFGPSRVLVLGPDSSLGPLIFAAITPLLVAGGDPATAIALAGMLALIVGLMDIGLGLGKLGFVADLLSKEVQVGYMNGLAVTIIVGQLPKLFGFSTDADGFVDEVRAFFDGLDQTNTTTLAVGLAVLAVLLVLPRFTRRVPAVLVAVVGATVLSAVLGLADQGVKTVGSLPQGFPVPTFPWTDISDVLPLMLAAVGITLVSLTDTIATATSFAARRGDEVEPDQEMIGMGAANVAAGFFQGFAVSTSSSRTAVAEQSGAKSQLTGLVGAGLVLLLLLFLNSLLADLPQTALAAVVIAAALSIADVRILGRYYRMRRVRPGPLTRRHGWRHLLRCAPGDHRGHRPGHPALLPAQLVAPRGRARQDRGDRRVAQRRRVSGRRSDPGHRRLPLGGSPVLCQRRDVSTADPAPGPRPPPRVDRAAMRGHHRHRRHRGRGAPAAGRRAQRRRDPHRVRRDARAASRKSRCAMG